MSSSLLGAVESSRWFVSNRSGPQPHPADQGQVVFPGTHYHSVSVSMVTGGLPVQMTMRLDMYAQEFAEAVKTDFKPQSVYEPRD